MKMMKEIEEQKIQMYQEKMNIMKEIEEQKFFCLKKKRQDLKHKRSYIQKNKHNFMWKLKNFMDIQIYSTTN